MWFNNICFVFYEWYVLFLYGIHWVIYDKTLVFFMLEIVEPLKHMWHRLVSDTFYSIVYLLNYKLSRFLLNNFFNWTVLNISYFLCYLRTKCMYVSLLIFMFTKLIVKLSPSCLMSIIIIGFIERVSATFFSLIFFLYYIKIKI